ncbi:MAG: AMP-binding protein [Vulcanimicrobiaceae bacterium]
MNTIPIVERWLPSPQLVENANVTRFLARFGVADYPAALAKAADDLPGFYEVLLAELGLRWDAPYSKLLDLSRGKAFARFFVDARFNVPGNCLDRHVDAGRGASTALDWEGEDGSVRSFTFAELRDEVRKLAGALRERGVGAGDAVGIFMPMVPEAAIALLAIGYIGGVAVPAFSGYGPDALALRLHDAGAKMLLTADGVSRRGKPVPMKNVVDEALRAAASVTSVLLFRRTGLEVPMQPGRDHDWAEAVAAATPVATYERTSANDPYLLLFTSGSTGKPKGARHVHAGFPLKNMIDQHLLFDVKPGDKMLWFTDMGWMMGPFMIFGALGLGASCMLYEGTPDFPTPDRLWAVCARHKVTHLGIAPTAIRALMAHGTEPPYRHDLAALRILGSSGEPWNTEAWEWYATHVGRGIAPIINYAGGTEVGGGIIGCFPTLPLVPNSFHGPVPGMVADVTDAGGNPVRGEVGELVVREPWVGMTQSFWGGDAYTTDDARYHAVYWERFPDTWVHGDWCSIDRIDDFDYWFIHGRSDDTINIAGKRVGPAEFEDAAETHRAIKEAAAIAVPDAVKGDVVILLVVARNPLEESEKLRQELFAIADRMLGKSLRPKKILFVDDLPKTRSQKIMRRVGRARFLGLDLGDLSALDNPDALRAIDNAR